jgi:CheY-like chemotaxis protein
MPRILLVDDSSFTRKCLRKMLGPHGYELLEAADGRLALEVIEATEPDCVVSDLIMPEWGGLELLDALRTRQNDVPVIVLTADVQSSSREECLARGAVEVLHKPPEPSILCAAVENALATHKRRAP